MNTAEKNMVLLTYLDVNCFEGVIAIVGIEVISGN